MQMERPIDFETARNAWFAEQRRRRLRERRRPLQRLAVVLVLGIGVGATLAAAGVAMLWPEPERHVRHSATVILMKAAPMKDQSRIADDASVQTSKPVGVR